VTDARSHVWSYAYDGDNRLTSTTSPTSISAVTSYAYDAVGNMTSLADPLSHVWSYTFDAANQQTGLTDARSQVIHLQLRRLRPAAHCSQQPRQHHPDVYIRLRNQACPVAR